jgi:hypothetical protein
MKKFCLHCFKPEDECCIHSYIEFPDNCVCDKGEWLCFRRNDENIKIPEICSKFEGKGKTCNNCEHENECHWSTNKNNNG